MRNRRNRSKAGAAGNASARSQETTVQMSQLTDIQVPDHDLNVMSVSNVNRAFQLNDYTNGPSVVYRVTRAYNAFWQGYSATGNISDQDVGAATDTTVTDPTDPLYPITPFADYVDRDVWPVLQALFQSGTGARAQVTVNEWVRYNAMLIEAYLYLQPVLVLNHLTYHFDWTKVFPFTDAVPKHLYDLCDTWNATDVGIAQTWLPVMRRFDFRVMFPRAMQEIKRLYTPWYSMDLNARINVPTALNMFSVDPNTILNDVIARLDYVDATLKNAAAVFESFLPFQFKHQDPWVIGEVMHDPDRDTGIWNSGVGFVNPFGDTGDPDNATSLMFTTSTSNVTPSITWFTRHTQPIWSEVKYAEIFQLQESLTDDTFVLISPHAYNYALLGDDVATYAQYDGTAFTSGDDLYYYQTFANSRFVVPTKVAGGVLSPGLIGGSLDFDSYLRLLRLEAGWTFSLETLRTISSTLAGASIREINTTILRRIVESNSSGY